MAKSIGVAWVLLMTFNVHAQDGPSKDGSTEDMKSFFFESAKQYEAFDAETNEKFDLVGRSILNWSNPERKTFTGGLFLWTQKSRPVIAMCAYPSSGLFEFEFQSLSTRPVLVKQSGNLVWRPEPEISWKELDREQWTPHASAIVQARQMKRIAFEFSTTLLRASKPNLDLRLQTSPVYRYPADQLPDKCSGGSVFCFVQGTDPELLVMIESVTNESGESVFRYALARTTIMPMQIFRKSELVLEMDWARKGYDQPCQVFSVQK